MACQPASISRFPNYPISQFCSTVRYLVGIGNYSGYDDSIGIRIVEHVCEKGLDVGFRALDLSSNSLNLFSYLNADTEAILVVDSAFMERAPGEFAFFTPDQIRSRKDPGRFSTHEGDVVRVLELARQLHYPVPAVTFMGIQPETIKSEFGLSATLQNRLPEYASAAAAFLAEGRPPTPR
jgi:hydrogenase maturation protease